MNDGLVLPFDTEEPEFRRGVEIGMLWARLSDAPAWEPVSATVHADCAEMLIRCAEAAQREWETTTHGDEWITIEFGPSYVQGSPE